MKQALLFVFVICLAVNLPGAAAAGDIHPLVFASGYQWTNYSNVEVFGAAGSGQWYNLSDIKMKTSGKKFNYQNYTQEQLMKGMNVTIDALSENAVYQLYSSPIVLLGKLPALKATYVIDGYANEILTLDFKSSKSKNDFVIGIGGNWNPFPRKSNTLVEKNVYLIDLDGDGKQETLRIERGRVALKDSEDKTYYEPGVRTFLERNGNRVLVEEVPVDGTCVGGYYVLPIDLNGDGKMELFRADLSHNTSISVYELQGAKVAEVLQYYVGD